MKKSFFEKLKNMFKKIKFDPLRGGGILLLISLSLFSGGFASFLVTGNNSQYKLNGAISVGNTQSYIEKIVINNTFTICQDGFLFSDGSIRNQASIVYDVYVDKTLIPSAMINNGNYLSFIFLLTNNDGYFIGSTSTQTFSYSIIANGAESTSNTITDTTLTSSMIDINIGSFDAFFELSINFEIVNYDNFYNNIFKNYASSQNQPTFSLQIKGVDQDG